MKVCKISAVFLFVLELFSGCAGDSANKASGAAPPPGLFGGVTNLALLQRQYSSAVISPSPWAGYWWPYSRDGISNAVIKYERARGVATDALSWERANHGTGLSNIAEWWGHCNGWSAAALLSSEPQAPVLIGDVVFGVADQKALLSETFMEVTGDFLGTRVDDANDTSSDAFKDLVPAQFYLLITGVMGAQKRPFVMDRYTGYQVWNHPAVAYFTKAISPDDYLGPDPQFANVHRVNIETEIWWVDDNVSPDVTTPAFDHAAPAAVFDHRTLRYELWLDAAPEFDPGGGLISSGNVILTSREGHVVGGVWKNENLPLLNSYPDYAWIPTGSTRSTGFKNPNIDDNWVLQNIKH